MANRALLALWMIGALFAAIVVIGYVISLILHAGRTARAAHRRCVNCQKLLPTDARFCSRCGHQLLTDSTPKP